VKEIASARKYVDDVGNDKTGGVQGWGGILVYTVRGVVELTTEQGKT